MTNPKKEPKEVSAEQLAQDQQKAFEKRQVESKAAWDHKSQREKIESLATGFNRVFKGLDGVMEGQEILSNLNAASYHTIMALIEALKLDKEKIIKRANEMWAADVKEQEAQVQGANKKTKAKSKKNVLPIQDQKPKA